MRWLHMRSPNGLFALFNQIYVHVHVHLFTVCILVWLCVHMYVCIIIYCASQLFVYHVCDRVLAHM